MYTQSRLSYNHSYSTQILTQPLLCVFTATHVNCKKCSASLTNTYKRAEAHSFQHCRGRTVAIPSLLVCFELCFRMGGIPAKTHKEEKLLIYLGIIDILQSYRYWWDDRNLLAFCYNTADESVEQVWLYDLQKCVSQISKRNLSTWVTALNDSSLQPSNVKL